MSQVEKSLLNEKACSWIINKMWEKGLELHSETKKGTQLFQMFFELHGTKKAIVYWDKMSKIDDWSFSGIFLKEI